VNQLIHTHSAK